MVEAKTPADISKFPRLSYKYFSETIDPVTSERVGYVPSERGVFIPGFVVFQEGDKVLDLGSGPGDSIEYLMGNVAPCIRDKVEWSASEPSWQDCEVMRNRFSGRVEVLNLDAIEAVKNRKANKVVFLNGVHLLTPDDRSALFNAIEAGQEFTFTTTFFEGAVDEQVQKEVLNPWLETLFNEARDRGIDRRAMIKRIKAIKEQTWSIEKYTEELRATGFELIVFETQEMPCTWNSYRTISHFGPFYRNIFPEEVPDRTASVICFTTLKKTMRRLGKTLEDPAPRKTLVVVARKPKIEGEVKRL